MNNLGWPPVIRTSVVIATAMANLRNSLGPSVCVSLRSGLIDPSLGIGAIVVGMDPAANDPPPGPELA